MYPRTAEELLRFATGLQGERLETRVRRAGFSVQVFPAGLEITPESSGSPRLVDPARIQLVLDEYHRTRSMRKRDYQDITFDASYLLALIGKHAEWEARNHDI
jgi:hypothetical protein